MYKFKFFIYDILNISNQKEISIEEFDYDTSTLVIDFYNVLYKYYIINNIEKLGKDNSLKDITYFRILDIVCNVDIDERNFDDYFYKMIERHDKEKVYCIVPVFPVGDTFATYHNYKIIIHPREDNHQRFPHVHVYNHYGESATVSLLNFKMSEGLDINRKDKEKILKYIEKNRSNLLKFYNQVLEHKEVEKVTIERIS